MQKIDQHFKFLFGVFTSAMLSECLLPMLSNPSDGMCTSSITKGNMNLVAVVWLELKRFRCRERRGMKAPEVAAVHRITNTADCLRDLGHASLLALS